MFKKNKFIVQPHSITIYPNNRGLGVGMFFAVFYILLFIVLNYVFNNQVERLLGNTLNYIYPIMAITPLIAWFVAKSAITFDEEQKAVFKTTPLTKQKVYTFQDLAGIAPITSNLHGYYYSLTSKNNVYGNGIRISAAYQGKDKSAEEFEQQILPALQQMLTDASSFVTKSISTVTDFKYYTNDGMVYMLKIGHKLLIWSIFIFCAAMYFHIKFPPDFSADWDWKEYTIRIGGFLAPVLMAFFYTKRTVFDTRLKTINTFYLFNSFKHQYAFEDFVRFQITRETYNFIYTGTDIDIALTNDHILGLKSFYKSKNVQRLIAETEFILKS